MPLRRSPPAPFFALVRQTGAALSVMDSIEQQVHAQRWIGAQKERQAIRVESATGPKILAPGFFCPKPATGSFQGPENRPGQALTRSLNESFFGAWFSHGNF
jgi:hypothetical protein